MREFGGAEPLVGEVVGLRTFRVDESGLLLPLYSTRAWQDGVNTADCEPPIGHHPGGPHPVPAPECECGFYAFGSPEAARGRQLRHVQAIVSCWGRVLAGSCGVRAEHARIDALWFSPRAPDWVRRRVASRYPSARIYLDLAEMRAAHPLTRLPCYARRRRPPVPRLAGLAGGAVLLGLGALPASVLHAHPLLWNLWLAGTGLTLALAGWLLVASRSAGHVAAALLLGGLLGWLVAPLCGLAGWLLRLPLLRAAAVGGGAALLGLRPRHFPVEATVRPRPFCGVRV